MKNFRRYLLNPLLICMLFGLSGDWTPHQAAAYSKNVVVRKLASGDFQRESLHLNELARLNDASSDSANLAGSWNGGDWGEVTITGDGGSYSGTYSDTFGCGKGNFSFGKTGARMYEGAWHDPDGQHNGTFTLTASADGKSLVLSWSATDGRDLKNQSSSWTRR